MHNVNIVPLRTVINIPKFSFFIYIPFVAILQKEDVSLTLLGVQGITTYLQSHNIREAHT